MVLTLISLFGPIAAKILSQLYAEKLNRGEISRNEAASFIHSLESNVEGFLTPAKIRKSILNQDARLDEIAAEWDKDKNNASKN